MHWFANWPPYMEGKESPKKEANYSRSIGGSRNLMEAHPWSLSWGCKMSEFPHQNLEVYTETLMRFNHVHRPDGFNGTQLSQGYVLENSSHCGIGGENVHSKDGSGWDLLSPESSPWINQPPPTLDDQLQHSFSELKEHLFHHHPEL